MMVFLDTNIFIYVVSNAAGDSGRKVIAQQLIAEQEFGLSVQVLQEFMDVTSGKQHLGLTGEEILEMIDLMATYPLVETSVSLARRAFQIQSRHGLRYWDAAIVAAAQEPGCETLYSEDLNHGQDYDGVRVINPFLELEELQR